MSSNDPYGTGQPGPWGQGGPASGPSAPPPYGQQPPPYGPPPPGGPPPGAPGSGYAFGPFAPQPGPGPGPGPGPMGPGPGAPPPPRGRARGLIILGVVALALILVGVGAAVLVRSRTAVTPSPTPGQTSGGPGPSTSAPPAGALPSDAVAGYLNALAAGDAAAALAYAAATVPPGPYMTDQVLAESLKRAPISQIDVPAVSDPTATTVTANYSVGPTPVSVDYGVQQIGGVWKLSAVSRTIDLGLVRIPSIPVRLNGVEVTSDVVDVLPGTYAFTTDSRSLTLGDRAVITVRHPNDFANVPNLQVSLTDAGRRDVLTLAKRSYAACLKSKVTRPKNCPFSWTDSSARYRQGSVRWQQKGSDPFRKPTVAVIERAARVGIPLRVRISGPCTFSGGSGTCSGNVTGRGVASIRLDKPKWYVVWLT